MAKKKSAKKSSKKVAAKTTKKKVAANKTKKKAVTKNATKKKVVKKKASKTTKKKVAKKPTANAVKKKTTKKKAAKKAPKKKSVKSSNSPVTKAVKKQATKKSSSAAAAAKKKSVAKDDSTSATLGSQPSVLQSPSYSGKPNKLPRDTYPGGTNASDFKCWGPPATVDGDFSTVRICDMGSFSQDGKDSNKFYHGAIVQDQNNNWYAYFEWGRTGATSKSFQFVACESEASARSVFASQLHSKNDRRGEWVTIAGIKTLRAKKGKDCYLVRPMATRSTGLPDARRIKVNDGAKKIIKKSSGKSAPPSGDPQTRALLQDLTVATVAYTRGSMADSSLPTQVAIDEARSILGEAQGRVGKIKGFCRCASQGQATQQPDKFALCKNSPQEGSGGTAFDLGTLERQHPGLAG